ncbi:hypothetical protein BS78_01G514500 [Paspalum vaginatum]|nr:hypothetical protein BS78_01G514500 [Paspalum vaginatum]
MATLLLARRKRSAAACFSFQLPAPRALFFFELLETSVDFQGVVTCVPLLDEPVTEGYSVLGFPIWWDTRRDGRCMYSYTHRKRERVMFSRCAIHIYDDRYSYTYCFACIAICNAADCICRTCYRHFDSSPHDDEQQLTWPLRHAASLARRIHIRLP